MSEQQALKAASNAELKEALKAVADTELLLSDVTNGFSFSEIGELIRVAADLPPVIRDAALMFPEWKALDDAGRADLVAYVEANCKYPSNMSVELFVQKLLEGVVLLSKLFSLFGVKAAA